MAKVKTVAVHIPSVGLLVQGRSVATLGQGMALVKIGKSASAVVRPEDSTTVLLKKAARALSKPGIDKSVVFRGPGAARIYAYSVDPKDPTKLIRKAANGERTVGRLVGGSFRASSKA